MTDTQRQELRALCESLVETIDDPLADEAEDWWMHLFYRDFFALRSLCNTIDRELSDEPPPPAPIEIEIGWDLDLGRTDGGGG